MQKDKEAAWALAKKKHRLSRETVRMAQALGLNPKKLGKIGNHKQEPWKAPLPIFIEELYEKQQVRIKAKREKAARQALSQASLTIE